MSQLSGDLEAVVGRGHVLTAPDARLPYERDWTGRFVGAAPAVVRPAAAAEVAAVVEVCRRHGAALVPQGGNTGLVGGGVPLAGEVVLSLRRLAETEVVGAEVVAGAGATLAQVQAAAAGVGRRYAVDFASRDAATVGGSLGTDAGGLHVVRWGRTRRQVVGLDAVLGTGEASGDLDLVGSEGTLGVVTAARLRLVPRHGHRVVALVAFASIDDAVAAVGAWRAGLEALEAAELVLGDGLQLTCGAFDLPAPFPRTWPAYVLVEAAADDDPTDELAAAMEGVTLGDAAVATDPGRREALWRYREDHTLAISTLGTPHKLDVTVPPEALAAFVAGVPDRVAAVAPGARTWIFGHVAVGNLHVNVTGVAEGDERVDEAVLTEVAAVGGSVVGEHGVGTAKRRWLHLSRTPDELAAFRARKARCDPDGVLNPNAVIPSGP